MALRHTLGMRLGALTVFASAFAVGPVASPTAAAVMKPDITVSITHLTPATLPSSGNVTIAGVVRNNNDHAWRNVAVRVAISPTPFVDHSEARAAITGTETYTGSPIAAPNATEEFGMLRAKAGERFSITLRRSQLPVSGADGVYPLGIQIVADNTGGAGGRTAIGRAVTFLPARAESSTPTRTVVLWPFLLPGSRRADGSYADETGLLKDVGPNGRMRNLLDLVRSTPKTGSDVLLDPSLLAVLHTIANRPAKTDDDRARSDVADEFLDDLTRLADGYSCAVIGFDRPDWAAVIRSPSVKDLTDVIDRATRGTEESRKLDCTHLEWPARRGATRPVLNALQANGAEAVIVPTWSVPSWQSTTGSLQAIQTPTSWLPLIVNDPLEAGLPGRLTVVGLRQVILSEAVFGSIATDSTQERQPSVIIVNPNFNPGPVSGAPLDPALGTEVLARKNLAATLRLTPSPYRGHIPTSSNETPVSQAQLTAAEDAADTEALLSSMLIDSDARLEHAQMIASLASQTWRGRRDAGIAAATEASKVLSRELADISVEGPRALTLSSRSGRFPISVQNHTPHAIRVGITIVSSAAGVTFKAPATVRVAAGESRTSTVDMNMDGQTATTVTVRLTAGDDATFGASTVFNVRSSRVGAALWIAIGISAVFVIIALVRRFGRPGHEPPHPTLPPTDFDD